MAVNEEKLIQIVGKTLRLGKKKLSKNTNLEEIIRDSMDLIELVAVLSHKYKIRVEPEKMNSIRTLGDVLVYINSNRNNLL